MAAAPPVAPQGVLSKADLQLGIQGFQRWDPDLKAKSQHELENARESLLFCRQFFKEDRNRSVALAQVILFLTMLQGSLDNPEMELEDVPWKADFYDKFAFVKSMQEKVIERTALKSKAALERKIDEVESAAVFLSEANAAEPQIPQAAHLQGAVVCLNDLYVHMEFRFANV